MAILNVMRDFGAALTEFTERWVPDSWVICMMLTALAIVLCLFGAGASVEETILAWGQGNWKLLTLAMQFTIAMVAASAVVASKPAYRLFDWMASIPNPEKPVQALLVMGIFSLITGYLNWAVCLIACALFTPFVLKRNPNTDVRVLIAAAYLGVGTVWHGGLSGSAPLILATPGNPLLSPTDMEPVVDRIYPVTETLFNSYNVAFISVIGTVGLIAVCLLHPRKDARTLTPEQIDLILPKQPPEDPAPSTPAEHIDQFRGWTWLAVLLLTY
ncbi:MAG: TIGR00366 family protein, partial [Gammaproteobacteria bacterium]